MESRTRLGFTLSLALLQASRLSSLDLNHLICETKGKTYDLQGPFQL